MMTTFLQGQVTTLYLKNSEINFVTSIEGIKQLVTKWMMLLITANPKHRPGIIRIKLICVSSDLALVTAPTHVSRDHTL